MANSARGEGEIRLGDKSYRVTMSMGTLAELSSALGVETLEDLQARLIKFSLPDMPKIVAAVLKGNGHDVPMEDINRMHVDDFFEQVLPAFFKVDNKEGAKPNGKGPQQRQKA